MGTPRIVPRKLGNFDFCVQAPPEASVQHLRVRALLQCLAPLVQVYSCSGAGKKNRGEMTASKEKSKSAHVGERERQRARESENFSLAGFEAVDDGRNAALDVCVRELHQLFVDKVKVAQGAGSVVNDVFSPCKIIAKCECKLDLAQRQTHQSVDPLMAAND